MKKIFIPSFSKYSLSEKKIREISKELPPKIFLVYSIQFKSLAEKISKILNLSNPLQILGCSKFKVPKNTDAILLIGSGKFHATNLALETNKPVFVLEENKLSKISKKEIINFKKKKKGAFLNYLNSKKVGILITTKPGQNRLKRALDLELKNKKKYYFVTNDLNTSEFENFEIDSWINTACPRLDMDSSKIINLDVLE